MKTLFSILIFFISINFVQSQNKIPFNKVKLKPSVSKKISNTPVAKIVKGEFVINTKALSKTMSDKSKITSYEILHFEKDGMYYLKRSYLVIEGKSKGALIQNFIPLKKKGEILSVDLNSTKADEDCKNTDCADCGEYASGSGTIVCSCGSDSGSCVNPGSGIIGTIPILETLFN